MSEKKYSGAICRGCYALGTACGKCEKCRDEQKALALSGIDADAQARDLLRPTEERVRRADCQLRDLATHSALILHQTRTLQDTVDLLKTLLAENKALRENIECLTGNKWSKIELAINQKEARELASKFGTYAEYNPDTHVAMPRESVTGLKRIVEEIDGVRRHGCWRDDRGTRLKDTPEWVKFYVELNKSLTAAQEEE